MHDHRDEYGADNLDDDEHLRRGHRLIQHVPGFGCGTGPKLPSDHFDDDPEPPPLGAYDGER